MLKDLQDEENEEYEEYEEYEEDLVEKEPEKREENEESKMFYQLQREARKYIEDTIGRYIPGYRHYENFENYQIKYPEREIQDYIDDMNREVTFEEYLNISLTAMRYFIRISPKLRLEVFEMTGGKPERLEWVFNSQELKEKFRTQYNGRLREFYGMKEIFKLVDALEEFMELGYYGDMNKLQDSSIHIPSPNQMTPFPKFLRKVSDPKALNTMRVGPTDFLNPFKATPVTHPIELPKPKMIKKVFNKKFRRMQGTPLNNMKFYSSMVSRTQHTLNHPIVFMPFIVKK